MIAIDTNVLLRYLLEDEVVQSNKATKLITGTEKVLVTDVVLTETIWTLKGKRYMLSRVDIVDVIHALFAESNIEFEDNQAVWCALKDYVNAPLIARKKQADFQDALIVNKAKQYGRIHNIEVSPIYTFDKAALEIDGTKQP